MEEEASRLWLCLQFHQYRTAIFSENIEHFQRKCSALPYREGPVLLGLDWLCHGSLLLILWAKYCLPYVF